MIRGRPRKIIRQVPTKLSLPEDILNLVTIELYSPLQGRIPYGELAKVVATLLREWLISRGVNVEGITNGE